MYMKLLFFGAFDNDKNRSFLEQIHMESTFFQFNLSFQTQRLSRDTSSKSSKNGSSLFYLTEKCHFGSLLILNPYLDSISDYDLLMNL